MDMDNDILPALEADVLDRLLRYVRIDTQSRAGSASYPSTPGQLDLLRLLHAELRAAGYADAAMDRFGYVTATLPATLPPDAPEPPVIAFFAHVDTSQDAPGKDVQPVVWRQYDGGELKLPGDPGQVLSPEESPPLAAHVGHDIVTSDGTTLLGADDKAGVAAAMAAACYLIRHPEIAHGVIKFAFNPDEEVGHGVDNFDVQSFGARYAYTLDAGDAGEVEDETFSADGVSVRFLGRSAHPGYAKGKLVNALKVAADFVAALPRGAQSPETTEGREGFVHPTLITGAAEEAEVKLIVRDFQTADLAPKEDMLRDLAKTAVSRHPGSRYEMTVVEQYRNMHDVLVNHPRVAALADEAVRRVGLKPLHRPIRGGTDGARLCAMGLPTPNIFAGWQMIHSRREWVSVQDMGKAALVVIELTRLWANEPATSHT
jgi:tripeptide aminopeptidase